MILFAIVLLILITPVMLLFIAAFFIPQATVQPIQYAVTSAIFASCVAIIWGGLFQ